MLSSYLRVSYHDMISNSLCAQQMQELAGKRGRRAGWLAAVCTSSSSDDLVQPLQVGGHE